MLLQAVRSKYHNLLQHSRSLTAMSQVPAPVTVPIVRGSACSAQIRQLQTCNCHHCSLTTCYVHTGYASADTLEQAKALDSAPLAQATPETRQTHRRLGTPSLTFNTQGAWSCSACAHSSHSPSLAPSSSPQSPNARCLWKMQHSARAFT